MKVVVARITSELPRYYEYYDSLDAMVTPPNTELLPYHSSSPAKNRNAIINAILEKGDEFTHIFFTDDDHVYPKNTLMRLLSHDVDIVSGMYTVKYNPFPIIALRNTANPNMSEFADMNQYKPGELIEMPRVPAGALLIKVSALREIGKFINTKYGAYPEFLDKFFTLGQLQPDEWADDLWFCDRAREAGYTIYLDTGAPVGHITKCTLMPVYNTECGCWEVKFMINEGYKLGLNPKTP